MPFKPASRALSRFTVLDLSRVRSGPTAVRQLADWGANVIKIEMPEAVEAGEKPGGPRHGPDFQNLHRNKRGLALNLKFEAGRNVLRRLVAQADVVVENFRPDVKHRLGIDYESLKAVNPRLVYASISGFGQDGPYRERPGFDQIAQGMGGLMSITGQPGEGQWVQTSLLQAQIAMLDFQAARWLMDGERPKQAGNNHPTMIPTGVFRTADGYINIAVTGQVIWERFCRAIERPDLITHPDFKTAALRSRNRDALGDEINAALGQHESATWIARFNDADVPSGPIYEIDEVFSDPQVQHLGVVQSIEAPALGRTISLLGQPVVLSGTPSTLTAPSPEPGEHTDEILAQCGYSTEDIAALRREGAV
jgi:crotonobetainyl-CoA:carnitine CoA-transferase CaiB-like acyl-CoA transferase